MDNHLAGELAELEFIKQAAARNYQVFLPMSHHSKIDVAIAQEGKGLIGVQVKKASRQKKQCGAPANSWKVLVGSARSGKASHGGRPRLKKYAKGMFDILAVWIEDHQCFAFYPLPRIAGKASLRWSPAKKIKNNWDIFNK